MKNDASCPCEGSSLVGFIQPIILSLLGEGPCHGYILMQNIGRTRLWKDNKPDAAGVYRALRDMEARGLIQSQSMMPGKAGPDRRMFVITEEGRKCARSWEKTLKNYRRGITEVIGLLGDMHGKDDEPDDEEPSGCCCGS